MELNRYPDLIVSRHPAAVEFVAAQFGGKPEDFNGPCVLVDTLDPWEREWLEMLARDRDDEFHGGIRRIPVVASASADDVRGKRVAGNLPLHLASLCMEVWAVEFAGQPPRGAEYTLDDMRAAGARLARYCVHRV